MRKLKTRLVNEAINHFRNSETFNKYIQLLSRDKKEANLYICREFSKTEKFDRGIYIDLAEQLGIEIEETSDEKILSLEAAMKESVIQREIIDAIKKRGWEYLKSTERIQRGVPDLLVFPGDGFVMFFELKAPEKFTRGLQEAKLVQYRGMGYHAYCLQSLGQFEAIMDIIGENFRCNSILASKVLNKLEEMRLEYKALARG